MAEREERKLGEKLQADNIKINTILMIVERGLIKVTSRKTTNSIYFNTGIKSYLNSIGNEALIGDNSNKQMTIDLQLRLGGLLIIR